MKDYKLKQRNLRASHRVFKKIFFFKKKDGWTVANYSDDSDVQYARASTRLPRDTSISGCFLSTASVRAALLLRTSAQWWCRPCSHISALSIVCTFTWTALQARTRVKNSYIHHIFVLLTFRNIRSTNIWWITISTNWIIWWWIARWRRWRIIARLISVESECSHTHTRVHTRTHAYMHTHSFESWWTSDAIVWGQTAA
jgi:hypothetical protein